MGFFQNEIIRISPPWLARTRGGAIMRAFGDAIDTQVARLADGVKARFPGLAPSDAIPFIGKDRKITRGPNESDETYAARLRVWRESHRTRGGPYALAQQLYLYWRSVLNVPFEIVYHSGRRYSTDTDGETTRDDITWSVSPSGTSQWAQFWIFFHVTALTTAWLTAGGEIVIDGEGDEIVFDLLSMSTLPERVAEDFRTVPRDWNAAHVKRITTVLLHGDGRLWDYPVPVPTYDDLDGAGTPWDVDAPVFITVEG